MLKLLCVLGAGACAIALAACGSSTKAGGTVTRTNVALEFSRCMRAHGVSNFPDPGAGGDLSLNLQMNPQSPSFQAAQQACKHYLPSKPLPGPMSASERAKAYAFAKCVRAHGESDFPDPTIGTPNPATTGRVLVLQGMFFAVPPNFDPRTPAFRQAASACGLTLPSKPTGGPRLPQPA